jgi:hypothetical protein
MTVAAATKRKIITLREQSRFGPSVDVAAGIIRNVKVNGLVSENNRRYLPEALARAAPLYEGKGVYLDHPDRPQQQRSARDRIGWLENVHMRPDGLYADLHLLTSDRDTAKVLEAAQKRPELFGLSHNAEGRGQHVNGVFVIEEITEVRSVDLVADPATNKSLFEGRTVPQNFPTLRELIEGNDRIGTKNRTALLEYGTMCEDGAMPPLDMPVSSPMDPGAAPDGGDEGGDWKQHLIDAIGKLVQSGDESDHAIARKIMALLKPTAPTVADAPVPEDVKDEDMDDNDANSAAQEGKRPKAAAAAVKSESITEARALALCKVAGVEMTADLMEALKGASLDQAFAIVNMAKRHLPETPRRETSAPRSASPRSVVPVQESVSVPKDCDGWMERLLR